MKILYITYQVCFALPILLVLTILTALVTIIGSLIGGAHTWGYYPGKIWSQLICYILLIPVEVHGREKIHKRTSYVFVPNHQGAFDIFLIYGFLGRNFKWHVPSRDTWATSREEPSSWRMNCNWKWCPSL